MSKAPVGRKGASYVAVRYKAESRVQVRSWKLEFV